MQSRASRQKTNADRMSRARSSVRQIFLRPTLMINKMLFSGCAAVAAILLMVHPRGAAQQPASEPTRDSEYPTEVQLKFHRTDAETQLILSSIDGIMNFSSEHSGLPIRSHVKGHLIDRDGVKQKIEENFAKEGVLARMQQSCWVLKKLGLVPRDFDVRAFVLDAQKESVLAGFYLPATKEFYMLDWIPTKQQLPVISHELTHALQDQYIGLENWIKPPSGEDGENVTNGRDEPAMARRAAAEGQAEIVRMDYDLAPFSEDAADLPYIDSATLDKLVQRSTAPAFLKAPRYIRESELFPYTYGLIFVHHVLKQEGKARAFAGMLRNPPLNSRQVMHPALYLAGESTPTIKLPPLEPVVGDGYERIDSGTLGEFDVLMFAKQFGAEDKAEGLASQWRGGYYFAVQPKPQKPGANDSPPQAAPATAPKTLTLSPADEHLESVGLFYLSRWATPAAAPQFVHLYSNSVLQRYSDATRKPGTPANIAAWTTSDGNVSVETIGAEVLVLESFDDPTAAKLRHVAFGREAAAKPQSNAAP